MPNTNTDIIHKELDLIQDIIKRMAHNSFKVKAWIIGILSALVVVKSEVLFAKADAENTFSMQMNLFLFLPIFCFWYLDAFFLSTEKLYRELYRWVVRHRPDTNAYLYDLNTFVRKVNDNEENLILAKNGIWKVAFSKTLWPFYLLPMVFVGGLLFYNLFRQ